MRILNLIPKLSGGGAERQLGYLAPELARMGHDMHIAYYMESYPSPEFQGVKLHKLNANSNYDPRLLWQILLLIRQLKPDIIHTWIVQMDILGGVAAKIFMIPHILREPSSKLAYQSWWKSRLRIWVGSFASAIVSNSSGGEEYWKSHLPSSHRYIVHNGLPINELEMISPTLPSGLEGIEVPVILYVGRLAADSTVNKNLLRFLAAVAIVRQQQNIIGILCGDGPQRSELELLSKKLGMNDSIKILGNMPTTEVWALMKNASVFVSLSAFEGCPNSVMEAMVCGCPLVLSDIPAHHEIGDEESALFVDPQNIQQTADAILRTLNNDDISKIRAQNAKNKTLKWTVTSMAAYYQKVYYNAQNKRKSQNVIF